MNCLQDSTKKGAAPRREDCPVDTNELGRGTWSLLHTMAAHYPAVPTRSRQRELQQFIYLFSELYPCENCAESFRDQWVYLVAVLV